MEDIGQLIWKGFGIWKRNLNLCIPYLLNVFASMLIVVAFLVAIFVAALPLMGGDSALFSNIEDLGETQASEEFFSQMDAHLASLEWQTLLMIVVLFLGMILVLSLVGSYFNAGAISMARQAQEEGRSVTSTIWSAGRKHYWNMFLLTLLMGLIILAGIIFLLPGIGQSAGPLPWIQDSPEGMGIFVVGIILFTLYALLLSIILSLAPYALVLEGLGPMAALRASIEFFRYNKFDVLILWLVAAALSIVLQMISSFLSMGEFATYQPLTMITGLANLLVLAPLTNLWWTRLYMIRKGILKVDEVKDPW